MTWGYKLFVTSALWCATGCYLHHTSAADAGSMNPTDTGVMVIDAALDAPPDATSMDASVDALVSDAPSDASIDAPIADGARDADVDAWVPPLVPGITYLKPRPTDAGVSFGSSVALSATTLVVGAPNDVARSEPGSNDGALPPGAIYVFVRSTDGWQRQQRLVRPSGQGSADYFGVSVAVSGDTLVAGSRGSAYVYQRNNGAWTLHTVLDGGPFTSEDQFGWDVAIDRDTIVVGAIADASAGRGIGPDRSDRSAYGSGAVHVFRRRRDVWQPQAFLKASNADPGDVFGETVSISGDAIVVGARYESSAARAVDGDQNDNSASQAGAAYVFRRNGEQWMQEAYLKASNTATNELFADQFGRCVAIDRDTIVVGAESESSDATGVDGDAWNVNAPGSGAAYVFARSGGRWMQQAYLKASTSLVNRTFGMSVSVWGDIVVVGAIYDSGVDRDDPFDPAQIDSGAAYLFHRNNGRWFAGQQVRAPNAGFSDFFGYNVALFDMSLAVGASFEASGASDINGDQADNSVPGNGAVYVFDAVDELGLLSP